MKRTLHYNRDILVGNNELVVEVSNDQLLYWVTEITLLLNGLTEQLTILSIDKHFSIKCDLKLDNQSKCKIINKKSSLVFILPKNHCEYLQMTLLKIYRDSAADVNHIHLEGEMEDKLYDLTIMFETTKPPLTSTEMSRHLKG